MLNDTSELIEFYNSEEEFNLAVSHTAEKTGFSVDLIEKDYLCSLLLMYLYSNQECHLIFKGGTLLAKVYADFYRLSEDLDFTIPIPYTATRKQRSNKIKHLKKKFELITESLPLFSIESELRGSNESRQYNMELHYPSIVSPRSGKLFIEIGLREELLEPAMTSGARSLLMDPYSETKKARSVNITGLSRQEAYAEKTRAALCRKKLAIRDFYDLDYAITHNLIDISSGAFTALVKKKIHHETHFHDFTDPEIIKFLKFKIKGELEPTLKRSGIAGFHLERITKNLLDLSVRINQQQD